MTELKFIGSIVRLSSETARIWFEDLVGDDGPSAFITFVPSVIFLIIFVFSATVVHVSHATVLSKNKGALCPPLRVEYLAADTTRFDILTSAQLQVLLT